MSRTPASGDKTASESPQRMRVLGSSRPPAHHQALGGLFRSVSPPKPAWVWEAAQLQGFKFKNLVKKRGAGWGHCLSWVASHPQHGIGLDPPTLRASPMALVWSAPP